MGLHDCLDGQNSTVNVYGQYDATAALKQPFGGLLSNSLSLTDCPKAIQILQACTDNADTHKLATLATSTSGLLDDEVRRLAWPLLLGYDARRSPAADYSPNWRDLPRHKDEDQVQLDVNRSFIYYPKNESAEALDHRKEQLSDVITQTLRKYPMLSYFQGFHDIVQVFLLVLGVDHAAEAVAHLALLRIRDFMLPSLSPSLAHLRLLPAILYAVDAKLHQHLSQTKPFFALAATLTLYAHDIQEYGDIARLFDFLLGHGAVVSIYFFAIVVLSRRDELFEIPPDEPEMLHSVLSKLPKPLDLEALISRTMIEFSKHPPENLSFHAWSQISTFSVLKTTRELNYNQTLEEGEDLFIQQQLQLRRSEMHEKAIATLWRYRRPVGGIGMAILFGILSIWWRRAGIEGGFVFGVRKFWDLIAAIIRK